MIRKLLVIAAAVAMPASALAAVTTIGSAGVAGAAAKTYTTMSCAVTGGVLFAKPGLSYNGSISSTSVSKAKSTAVATGPGCGKVTLTDPTGTVNTTKNTITTASLNCNTAPAPLPGACALETLLKFYAYDTASSLASSGVASIVTSLGSLGISLVDNHNAVKGDVTVGGTTSVVGGACGAGNVGFQLAGGTKVAGIPVPGLTYTLLLCIVGDTGNAGATGAFGADYIAAAGGNTAITIASGIYGASTLSFVKV